MGHPTKKLVYFTQMEKILLFLQSSLVVKMAGCIPGHSLFKSLWKAIKILLCFSPPMQTRLTRANAISETPWFADAWMEKHKKHKIWEAKFWLGKEPKFWLGEQLKF